MATSNEQKSTLNGHEKLYTDNIYEGDRAWGGDEKNYPKFELVISIIEFLKFG